MPLRKLFCLLFGCRVRTTGAEALRSAGDELRILCSRCSRVRVRLVKVQIKDNAALAFLTALLLCTAD